MADKAEIIAAMQRLVDLNMRGRITDIYIHECAKRWVDLPIEILEKTLDAWITRSRFIPTIAELAPLIHDELERRACAHPTRQTLQPRMTAIERDRACELLNSGLEFEEASRLAANWKGDEPCACGHVWLIHKCPVTGLNINGRCETCSQGVEAPCLVFTRKPATTTNIKQRVRSL